jgi:hypothetical protein
MSEKPRLRRLYDQDETSTGIVPVPMTRRKLVVGSYTSDPEAKMSILPAVRQSILSAFQPAAAALRRLAARHTTGFTPMMDGGTERLDEPNEIQRDYRRSSFARFSRAPMRQINHTGGGIFHPLLASLSVDAARINAAIHRHPHLRRQLDQAD